MRALLPLCFLAPFITTIAWSQSEPPASPSQPDSTASATAATEERPEDFRFVAYNLKNWLRMERRVAGEVRPDQPKPDMEKEAVITMIKIAQPDVLGVCEIGDDAEVKDLQDRLKAAGVDLPHRITHRGNDPTRHLALLSKFPVLKNESVSALPYTIGGANLASQRGILDVTLQVDADYQIRLLGNHLKSRREVPEADEKLMRLHEASLLRKRVDDILEQAPETNLLVYGDLNDTKNEPPIPTVQGSFGEKSYLRDIWLSDSDGYRWTYYWAYADKYERIDYVMVNEALWPEVQPRACHLVKNPAWDEASDHRPLVVIIEPENRKKRRQK